jgi:hypothetical protein
MSLDHDFLLLATAEHSPADYGRFIHHPDAVRLHDDVLQYIWDSLRWIPTLNPATGLPGQGLNYYGPTAILADGAEVAARVLRAWADVFRNAPPELQLTGAWTTIDGAADSGHYQQLRLSRDAVVGALDRVAGDCELVAGASGRHFVLHIGI